MEMPGEDEPPVTLPTVSFGTTPVGLRGERRADQRGDEEPIRVDYRVLDSQNGVGGRRRDMRFERRRRPQSEFLTENHVGLSAFGGRKDNFDWSMALNRLRQWNNRQ
jgi:hypothetical protein